MTPRCLLCGSNGLRPCFDAHAGSVTSDCRPWPLPPRTATCPRCGHLQKADTGLELGAVYAGYQLYRLSDGAEQVVFAGAGATPRSAVLAEKIEPWLPAGGSPRMLDVGCGNGATLKAFHARHPDWALYGFEIDDKTRDAVLALPGVRGFYSGSPEAVEGTFDLISMVHVFEHVTTPGDLLDRLRPRLAPGGLLLIEVPNALESPFDTAIIDHCSHFSPGILAGFARGCGYEVVHAATDWLAKECSLVLRAGGPRGPWPPAEFPAEDVRRFHERAAWLGTVLRDAEEKAATSSSFGLFGTAIAGTWLGARLGDRLKFFVDDDPSRAGKLHLGKPVLRPRDVDPASTVYLAFPPAIAERLRARLVKESSARWTPPPERS